MREIEQQILEYLKIAHRIVASNELTDLYSKENITKVAELIQKEKFQREGLNINKRNVR